MVKLGLHSFSYHLHLEDMDCPRDPLWFLKKTLDLGLEGCHISPRHLHGWDEDLVHRIGEYCQTHGLYLDLGSGGFDYIRLGHRLEIAAEVGARLLCTFIGSESQKFPEDHRQQVIDSAIENFKRLADVAERVDIPISIENHEDLTSDELIDIIEIVDSKYVRACVDNANSIAVWESPYDCVERLSPYAIDFHLKDFRHWWEQGVMQKEGCPLGSGDAQVADCYSIFRRTDPEMPITLEIPTIGPYFTVRTPDEEEENVLRSIAYIRSLESVRDEDRVGEYEN